MKEDLANRNQWECVELQLYVEWDQVQDNQMEALNVQYSDINLYSHHLFIII